MVEVLARSGIQIRKYEDVLGSLQEQQKVEGKIWVDGNSANVAIYKYATAQMLK
jgi:DNA-binding transcriptional regulator of glucitol operon